ncbi:hypothetical protein [Amnibacterium kyonggiense]
MSEQSHITEELVQRLIARQFPMWTDLPVQAVARQGWDNRTFRIGSDLVAGIGRRDVARAGVPAV